jgi:ATP-dependent DNA helicase RecQ
MGQGYLAQTEGQFPAIILTEKSLPVLKGEEQVELFKVTVKEDKSKSLVSHVSHEYFKDLFDNLKQVRTIFARGENVPPYVVFSDATLVEMATYLPQNEMELRKISGVGELKLEKYGADFLEAIKDYCAANDLASRIDLKLPKREQKSRTKRDATGKDTFRITLEMFHGGLSISEIAERRELSKQTIETHLVRFIPTGEIKIEDLVQENKIETIRNALVRFSDSNALSPIKEYLGDDYTYGEIRAVMATML